jgi:hypothetical protein
MCDHLSEVGRAGKVPACHLPQGSKENCKTCHEIKYPS